MWGEHIAGYDILAQAWCVGVVCFVFAVLSIFSFRVFLCRIPSIRFIVPQLFCLFQCIEHSLSSDFNSSPTADMQTAAITDPPAYDS